MGPLSTVDPGFLTFLQRVSVDADQYRMTARNFLLDEGVVSARCDSYRASGAAAPHGDRMTWRAQHEKYLQQQVFRPSPGTGVPAEIEQADEDLCPESFRLIAPDSPFFYSDRTLDLVRTEELSFVSRLSGVPHDRLKRLALDAARYGNGSAGFADLDSALRTWAKQIDLRPVFAAFWEDLADLFGHAPDEDGTGWANRLRDRLGLVHLDPGDRGAPIDVLVFRYQIGDLARIRELGEEVRALVPPTVIDGKFSDAFCPPPRGAKTGHTLDLSGACTGPRREVLHPTFSFGARHLWRAGTIDVPVDLSAFGTLRGLHLVWLREQTGVGDYAADTDGDLL